MSCVMVNIFTFKLTIRYNYQLEILNFNFNYSINRYNYEDVTHYKAFDIDINIPVGDSLNKNIVLFKGILGLLF